MSRSVCIITGAGGLIGSEAVRYFSKQFDIIVGIDCDARKEFFGETASVSDNISHLLQGIYNFRQNWSDITDRKEMEDIFKEYGTNVRLIIHCAAQPSHDYAADHVFRDFEVNALGTLNLLEAYRHNCPNAVFIFTSTNKVYGDSPNRGNWDELETRYEPAWYKHWGGDANISINEEQSIDQSLHSLFGVSKAAADLLCQEYARYFHLPVCIIRGGCLSGEGHKGVPLHGFLSYLVKCAATNTHYNIYGTGKQVRDNIHASDVVSLFDVIYKKPYALGQVFNVGGGRSNSISVLEVIAKVNKLLLEDGLPEWTDYTIHPDKMRTGDHIWYITDLNKVKAHYPEWPGVTVTVDEIIKRIYNSYKSN